MDAQRDETPVEFSGVTMVIATFVLVPWCYLGTGLLYSVACKFWPGSRAAQALFTLLTVTCIWTILINTSIAASVAMFSFGLGL